MRKIVRVFKEMYILYVLTLVDYNIGTAEQKVKLYNLMSKYLYPNGVST